MSNIYGEQMQLDGLVRIYGQKVGTLNFKTLCVELSR